MIFIVSRYNKRKFKLSERDDFQWIHFVKYKVAKTGKTNLPTHGVKPESDDCPGGQWLCSPEIRQFYDCMCVVVLILHASVKKSDREKKIKFVFICCFHPIIISSLIIFLYCMLIFMNKQQTRYKIPMYLIILATLADCSILF